jgi:hypothetical protein
MHFPIVFSKILAFEPVNRYEQQQIIDQTSISQFLVCRNVVVFVYVQASQISFEIAQENVGINNSRVDDLQRLVQRKLCFKGSTFSSAEIVTV